MHKGKPTSLVLVLVVVMVAALALVGCGGSETKVTADEVVQDALAAQAGVETSSLEITIDATVVGTVNDMNLDVSLDGILTGDMDWDNKKMQAHMGMNVGLAGDFTFQTQVTGDMYAFDNVSYMQLTMMGNTDNWSKGSFPADFWLSQDSGQPIDIDSILQSTEAELLTSQKVGGVNCHVLQLTPDIAALQQMLGQEAASLEDMPDIDSLISSLSIKVWVAKDTSYVTKIEVKVDANIPAEVLGGSAGGEGLAINLTVTMEATKFNEAASIELPAEAENAEWGNPLDMFSGFGF